MSADHGQVIKIGVLGTFFHFLVAKRGLLAKATLKSAGKNGDM